jgi:hypothetical protein
MTVESVFGSGLRSLVTRGRSMMLHPAEGLEPLNPKCILKRLSRGATNPRCTLCLVSPYISPARPPLEILTAPCPTKHTKMSARTSHTTLLADRNARL